MRRLTLLRGQSARFRSAEAGSSGIEYTLIAAGVGLAVFIAVKLLAPSLNFIFKNGTAVGQGNTQHLLVKTSKE